MRRSSESESQPGNAALTPYAAPAYSAPGAGGAYAGASGGNPLPMMPAGRNVPTFMGLLNALKRRWVLASFLGLLVGTAAAVALWIAAPQGKHQVKALLKLKSEVDGLPGTTQQVDNSAIRDDYNVLIKTRTLLARVAQNPKLANTQLVMQSDDPAKAIEDMLRTTWPSGNIMAVMMNGDRPDEMQKILDELTKSFCDETKLQQALQRQQKKDSAEKARDRLQADIQQLMNQSRNNTDIGIPQNTAAVVEEIKSASSDREKAKTALRDIDGRLATLSGFIQDGDAQLETLKAKKFTDEEIEAALLRDREPALLGLQAELDAVQMRLKQLEPKVVDPANNARVKELRDDVARIIAKRASVTAERRTEVEKRLRAERREDIEKGLRSYRTELAGQLASRKKSVDVEAETTARLTTLNKNALEVFKMDKQLLPKLEEVERLNQQIMQLKLAENADARVFVQESAQSLPYHNQRQKLLYSGLLGLVTFLAVLGLVAYLEWRSRRVDSVDQVVNELGMRVVGTIPAFPSRQSIKTGEADVNQNWRFILNESVNSTRTMLLHTAKSQGMQVIMVTSAMQGEGKTSLSSQLATSMATAGLRTLIVDCDLRNPSMHRLFDLPLAPGCSEILLSELDVSDAVQPTTVPNLWVISAGQCSNRVIAALAQGHQLESLFNRLRGQFDFIVVDSCPVLPVADTLLIGQHVDGVLISILQDISQLPKVLDASDRLSQLNIPLLGAVVNGIKTDIHAYGYNYVKQLPA